MIGRSLPPWLLDGICHIPRDTESLESYHRRRHGDLAFLEEEDLDAEEIRVSLRFALDPDPYRRAWLRERWSAIRAERDRRASEAAEAARLDAAPVTVTWGPWR